MVEIVIVTCMVAIAIASLIATALILYLIAMAVYDKILDRLKRKEIEKLNNSEDQLIWCTYLNGDCGLCKFNMTCKASEKGGTE